MKGNEGKHSGSLSLPSLLTGCAAPFTTQYAVHVPVAGKRHHMDAVRLVGGRNSGCNEEAVLPGHKAVIERTEEESVVALLLYSSRFFMFFAAHGADDIHRHITSGVSVGKEKTSLSRGI